MMPHTLNTYYFAWDWRAGRLCYALLSVFRHFVCILPFWMEKRYVQFGLDPRRWDGLLVALLCCGPPFFAAIVAFAPCLCAAAVCQVTGLQRTRCHPDGGNTLGSI
jgi:hypothetical protein